MGNDVIGVTLETLAGGAALELFGVELDKVVRNIADPNTDPKAVRKLTLEVIIKPTEDREMAFVNVKAASKLASLKPAATTLHFGKHQGRIVAVESDPRQQGLFDEKGPVKIVPLNSKGGE